MRVLSIDAYHYFGSDDLYLSYLAHFLAPGGRLGVVSPGLLTEIEARAHRRHFSAGPPHLRS